MRPDLIFTVSLGVLFAIGIVSSSPAQDDAARFGKAVFFDIAPQPLAQALDIYARSTGMAALVDQENVAGRRSARVKGLLTPDQALRILLAGTDLSVRYANGDAFTLEPTSGTAVEEAATSARGVGLGGGYQTYFADLQDAVTQVLCRRPETQPGRYRLGLQLWIGPSGAVLASHLLDSTGDDQRDAIISDLLGAATLAAPPAELAQPVTLVLLAQPAKRPTGCPEAGRHPG
jgi:hypothetical protein